MDSLLIGGEDVEILLIDDGSTDRTGRSRTNMSETIRESCVRVQQVERRTRLRRVRRGGCTLATGCYFKVVDSDDWLSEDAYAGTACVKREGVLHGSGGRNLWISRI
ncbi:MAG: glycosyltransferase family A protein [Roseburia hominis]